MPSLKVFQDVLPVGMYEAVVEAVTVTESQVDCTQGLLCVRLRTVKPLEGVLFISFKPIRPGSLRSFHEFCVALGVQTPTHDAQLLAFVADAVGKTLFVGVDIERVMLALDDARLFNHARAFYPSRGERNFT